MGNDNSFAEAFHSTCNQNCVSASLVLSLVAHRRASPLISGTHLGPDGQLCWASARRKQSRVLFFFLRDWQRVNRQAPGCWHLATFILWLHTGTQTQGTFPGQLCGRASCYFSPAWAVTEATPWGFLISHHVWWEPFPLRFLGLFTCVLFWATVICSQETESLVNQSLKPADICPLGRS